MFLLQESVLDMDKTMLLSHFLKFLWGGPDLGLGRGLDVFSHSMQGHGYDRSSFECCSWQF